MAGGRGSGAHIPPQTPLLFRDSSRDTLGQSPAGKASGDDGDIARWFKYTERISKVQFCTCIRKKKKKIMLLKEIKNLSDTLSDPQQSFSVCLFLLRTEQPPTAGWGGNFTLRMSNKRFDSYRNRGGKAS